VTVCSRSRSLPLADELDDGCRDLLGEGRGPARRPSAPASAPSPARAVSLNSWRLTLAFLPPPLGGPIAPADVLDAPSWDGWRCSEVRVLSRVERDETGGRSKIELPTDEAAADEAGDAARGDRGRDEGGSVGVGAVELASARSERARERAAGEGVLLDDEGTGGAKAV